MRNVCIVFKAVTRRGISIQMETRGLCDQNEAERDFYLWLLGYHQRLDSLQGLCHGCLVLWVRVISYDLEIKARTKQTSNKRTEIESFGWFIERIQTRVAFGW